MPLIFCAEQSIWRCIRINDLMINEEIRDREVRVVGQDGAQLGIMPTRQALELAEEKQLDLVKIAPTARPPVCKLMDYGKYRFEQSKKEREIRKNQKVIEIKEVRLSATSSMPFFRARASYRRVRSKIASISMRADSSWEVFPSFARASSNPERISRA